MGGKEGARITWTPLCHGSWSGLFTRKIFVLLQETLGLNALWEHHHLYMSTWDLAPFWRGGWGLQPTLVLGKNPPSTTLDPRLTVTAQWVGREVIPALLTVSPVICSGPARSLLFPSGYAATLCTWNRDSRKKIMLSGSRIENRAENRNVHYQMQNVGLVTSGYPVPSWVTSQRD